MIKFDSLNKEQLLFLDIGNTAVKAAFKRDSHWETVHVENAGNAAGIVDWIKNNTPDFKAIVASSVRNDITEFILNGELNLPATVLRSTDIPPDMLDYNTPETLGVDRFLACYGATGLTENAAVVIDAGTATTIDFMGADDVFRGGMIVPGYYSFSRLLRRNAPALPEADDIIPESFPGRSTADSLRWGQAGFYITAVEGMLYKYQKTFGDFELYLTGGDAAVLAKMLSAESKIRPFLVFEGMERFLELG